MKIIENGTVHNVSLKVWDNNASDWAFGGADCSNDIMYDPGVLAWDRDEEAYRLIDGVIFAEWFGWWSVECDLYNKRSEQSWFVQNTDDPEAEWALNREYIIFDN